MHIKPGASVPLCLFSWCKFFFKYSVLKNISFHCCHSSRVNRVNLEQLYISYLVILKNNTLITMFFLKIISTWQPCKHSTFSGFRQYIIGTGRWQTNKQNKELHKVQPFLSLLSREKLKVPSTAAIRANNLHPVSSSKINISPAVLFIPHTHTRTL